MCLERATHSLSEIGRPVEGELLQYLSRLGWGAHQPGRRLRLAAEPRLEDGKFKPLRLPGIP